MVNGLPTTRGLHKKKHHGIGNGVTGGEAATNKENNAPPEDMMVMRGLRAARRLIPKDGY